VHGSKFIIFVEELPALVINDKIYSGYREISRALKETNLICCNSNEESIVTLANREFLLQMNQNLFIEEFKNEEIFSNFTEPALLRAKSRYYWNFVRSRIFPLNYQIPSDNYSSLNQISVIRYFNLFFIIIFIEKITKD
jgi:hypothetical protein